MLPMRTSRQYRARCTFIHGRTCTHARTSTDGFTSAHTGGTRVGSATNISSIAAGTVVNVEHIASQDKPGGLRAARLLSGMVPAREQETESDLQLQHNPPKRNLDGAP